MSYSAATCSKALQTGTCIPARLSPSLDAVTMETEALEEQGKKKTGSVHWGNFAVLFLSGTGPALSKTDMVLVPD